MEEEPTSGLFGRMLAKHLNLGRKELRRMIPEILEYNLQRGSSIGVSQIGEAGGKKTATQDFQMRILGELADMLDNGSDFGGDESGAYEGV